jgi:DNA polymerase elongation subunit (family B)
MPIIYLDIETIPSGLMPTTEEMLEYVPANYKKPETINSWAEDPVNKERVYLKRALSFWDAQVVCIGYAIDDNPVALFVGDSEKDIFASFHQSLTKDIPEFSQRLSSYWCGYNLKEFDLPILRLRAIKYGIMDLASVLPGNPRSPQIIEVMELASVTAYKEFSSQHTVAKFFGLEFSETDGSDVYHLYKDGDLDGIIDHCNEDIELTRKLYKLLK